MPVHASQMYARNIQNLLDLLIKGDKFDPDYEDEIVKGTVITRNRDIIHEMTRQRLAEEGAPSSAQNLVSAPERVQDAGEPQESAARRVEGSGQGINSAGGAANANGGTESAVPAGAIAGDGSSDCPADYPIKGNASSAIYHEPDSGSYGRTIPEICFNSVDAAEAAGYRASRA
jgi:hypothetical protein